MVYMDGRSSQLFWSRGALETGWSVTLQATGYKVWLEVAGAKVGCAITCLVVPTTPPGCQVAYGFLIESGRVVCGRAPTTASWMLANATLAEIQARQSLSESRLLKAGCFLSMPFASLVAVLSVSSTIVRCLRMASRGA
jgi:hypothetical protein